MRRTLVMLPLAILLAGCAAVPVPIRSTQPLPSASWLAGTWLVVNPIGEDYPLACSSDAPVRFTGDGRYVTHGEAGRWSMAEDRLTLTPSGAAPAVARIERVDADTMRQGLDGLITTLKRCPTNR